MIDDFDLIVSSFRSQYGVSIYSDEFKAMTWGEFRSLLAGLGEATPLARTVQIRLENDKKVLKNFTPAQRRIRSKWRSKNAKHYSEQELNAALTEFESFFKIVAGS